MLKLKPIGIIHSEFTKKEGMPIQPASAENVNGHIEVFEEYKEGLKDLDGFSHIILIYYFHLSEGYKLNVVPFMDTVSRGLFATRAPKRPNPIGLSVVKLRKIENHIIYVSNLDILDSTPLIDIKPYVPEFDNCQMVRTGWIEKVKAKILDKKSDDRFNNK